MHICCIIRQRTNSKLLLFEKTSLWVSQTIEKSTQEGMSIQKGICWWKQRSKQLTIEKKDHAALDAMPVWPKKKGQASLEKEQNLFPQSVPNALQSHIIVWSIFKRNTKNEKLLS